MGQREDRAINRSNTSPPSAELAQLRELLIGKELDDVKAFIADWASQDRRLEDLAELLPQAIERGDSDNDRITEALFEPVSKGLQHSIEEQPKYYADILYPVLAPAIRKAVSQAFSSFLTTLQKTLAAATTFSGVWLRVKALFTGVPYAQLVLMQSLVFRVEHVYLIERESGMSIAEAADPETSALDSDAVAAMFSALESFVNDSFKGDESDRLTDLKVGERNVWVVHGPKLMLAAVIFGDAAEDFKNELADAIDAIHVDYAHLLHHGDSKQLMLPNAEATLEPLLQSKTRTESEPVLGTFGKSVAMIVALALIVYGLVLWANSRLQVQSVEAYLSSKPGFLVTQVRRHDERIEVYGLRDPIATLSSTEIAALGLAADELVLSTRPFISLEPEIEKLKLTQRFNLPASVDVLADGAALELVGQVPLEWALAHEVPVVGYVREKRLTIERLWIDPESVFSFFRQHGMQGMLERIALNPLRRDGCNGMLVVGPISADERARLDTLIPSSCWLTY